MFQALEFCDAKSRSNGFLVSKRYSSILTSTPSFRWRLERLHIEDGIYYSPLNTNASNYKSRFIELRRKKKLWRVDEGNVESNIDNPGKMLGSKAGKFNINVSVRLKPSVENTLQNDEGPAVTLPLHQRLTLLKMKHNLPSNNQAIGILKEQGEWFKSKNDCMDTTKTVSNEETLNVEEKKSNENDFQNQRVLSCGINEVDYKNSNIAVVDPIKGLRNFEFDHVFPESSDQACIYDKTTINLVGEVINGLNATILCYGQTGSGKTWTMFGEDKRYAYRRHQANMEGLVPRACREIFDAVKARERKLELDIKATVSATYVEVYGNEINDLLRKRSPCGNNRASAQRYVLSGAAEVPVKDLSAAMDVLWKGNQQRRMASTAMNKRSSRAHSIFIVTLRQNCITTGILRTTRLFMVDLGGCEKLKKSKIDCGHTIYFEQNEEENICCESEERQTQLQSTQSSQNKDFSIGFLKSSRMREVVNINLGLMALKSCVKALNHEDNRFVPYSDSKLTMMLSSGLGGDSKTSVIICVAQEKRHASETVSALNFGRSCRQVSNVIKSSSDFTQNLVRKLDVKILKCEEIIKKKERWEVHEERRQDIITGKGSIETKNLGGIEIRKTTVLVGAEKERRQLNIYLSQRAQLTGDSIDGTFEGWKVGGEIGFGNSHVYGIGKEYIASANNPYRFQEKVENCNIPNVVKSMGGTMGWKTGEELIYDVDRSLKKSGKANGNNTVYSNLSL